MSPDRTAEANQVLTEMDDQLQELVDMAASALAKGADRAAVALSLLKSAMNNLGDDPELLSMVLAVAILRLARATES